MQIKMQMAMDLFSFICHFECAALSSLQTNREAVFVRAAMLPIANF